MSQSSSPNAVFTTERTFPVTPQQLFAAFERPELLAQWWGPEGFTNTFQQFEFTPGGRWLFVMHAPNGANHPNEHVFQEIEPNVQIVIDHVVEPVFRLTVTLTDLGGQTRLRWDQQFENAEFVEKARDFLNTANGQVLGRLGAVLTKDAA